MKVEESLNVTFDETPPPPKTSPLEDDELVEEAIENETLKDENWVMAMQEELNQFKTNDVWELVPNPMDMTIRGTKWVYRNKLDENGVVTRNKASFINEEVYVALPPGFIDFGEPNYFYRLKKELYGLKQAPKS
nr:hypothetical protein [Tanacetum cinerariifolium]